MYYSDQPIKTHTDDFLERESFAQSLGKHILGYQEPDSIVIGLYGSWGSGKTSIVNMTIEYIEKIADYKDNKKPLVVQFNPWNFSEQNQLCMQFFNHLSRALNKPDFAGDAKTIGNLLSKYSAITIPFSFVPTIGPFALMISKLLKTSGEAALNASKLKSDDLEATKKELNKFLKKTKQQIIIILDDIDRLNKKEIRQVFQLVKSLGDFPYTIYLLAFDTKIVKRALKDVQGGTGQEYLDKVVQIPFEVPKISQKKLSEYLDSMLSKIKQTVPRGNFDEIRWLEIFDKGFRDFFKNMRDINRYINTLNFEFDLVKEEVNAIDFFTITAIQVIEPEVFYQVRNNKELFLRIIDYDKPESLVQDTPEWKDRIKNSYESIISKARNITKENLKSILINLFPKMNSIYRNEVYSDHWETTWRREGRICSPENFDNFFMLVVESGEVSLYKAQKILSLANIEIAFRGELQNINENEILKYIRCFYDFAETIPPEHIETIVVVLIDLGDLFPQNGDFFPGRIIWVLRRKLLRILPTQDERYKILEKAIQSSKNSLYHPVLEVSLLDQEHGRFELAKGDLEPEVKRTVSGTQLDRLELLALELIREWVHQKKLIDHPNLAYILYRWREWGNKREIDEFIYGAISENEGFMKIICAFIDVDPEADFSISLRNTRVLEILKSMDYFIDMKTVESKISSILSPDYKDKLSGKQTYTIQLILEAIKILTSTNNSK